MYFKCTVWSSSTQCCCSHAFLCDLQLQQLLLLLLLLLLMVKRFALHVHLLLIISETANKACVVPATTSRCNGRGHCTMCLHLMKPLTTTTPRPVSLSRTARTTAWGVGVGQNASARGTA